MAAVLPTGPPQPQPGPMQMDPSASSSREPIPQLSWEGDKMFNIYILDYCTKRGFTKTAKELILEAELGSDAAPPINARQGLLFEWWSVFWVLFQAKSGNTSQEDALLYIQHQNAQKAVAQRLQGPPLPHPPTGQQPQSGAPMPLGNQPQQQPSHPQSQPPVNRMSNGMPMQRQPPAYHANGAMPNGISPAMGGQPTQPGQVGPQNMQGQPGAPMNFVGIGGQPNGVPGAQQPLQGGPQPPTTQAMPFNPMMSGSSVQRPPMNGQPQPGQQQAGRGPFTSPPMAHSPQGGQPAPPQPGQQGPMAQLGPSPHMTPINRTMLPPNGGPSTGGAPMNPPPAQSGGLPFSPGSTQGPHGQQGPTAVRPPSRTRPSPSPSLTARQPPGMPQQGGINMMGGMMTMGGMPGMPPMAGMNVGGMPAGMGQDFSQELSHIPLLTLNALKQDLGYGDKDSLNMTEKGRILSLWRTRNGGGQPHQQRKDSLPGPIPGGMLPPQPQMQQQRAGPPPTNMRMKRGSSSPDENDTQPRTESSPPDRKRVKREPEQSVIPPGYSQHPPPGVPGASQSLPPQQQGAMQPPNPQQSGQPPLTGPTTPQQMMPQQPHPMLVRQQQMGASGPNPGGQGQAGPGSLVLPPNPSVMGMPMHPGPMQPQGLFRPGAPPGSSGPPSAPTGPTQFNATPLTRLGQPKPNMMPTPSPGMNGPPKDATKDNKVPQPNGQSQPQGQQQGPEASPRNAPAGTAPPTPVATSQTIPAPGGTPGGSATHTPAPGSQPPPPPPPLSMLSMPMNIPGMNAADLSMFEPSFMAGMEEFGQGSDLNINFERDFGQWFTSAEDGTILDP